MYIRILKKVVMNMEQNTKHAARETQIERQVEKKIYTYNTRLTGTDKETRNVRERDPGYYWYSAKVGHSHSTVPTQRLGRYRYYSERNV